MSIFLHNFTIALIFYLVCGAKAPPPNTQSKIFSYPLYGNVTDILYYYANIYVGNPPQQQSVIIDTGSSFVGVPCKQSCGSECGKAHRNALYDSDVSNSFTEESCQAYKISSCDCRQGRCYYHQVL